MISLPGNHPKTLACARVTPAYAKKAGGSLGGAKAARGMSSCGSHAPWAALPPTARGDFTPKSPKVQELIAGGVKVLEGSQDGRVGAEALAGLTVLKADVGPQHPIVQRALAAVQKAQSDRGGLQSQDVYTIGLCVIFLVELDPVAYKSEIQTYLDHLLSIQKENGAWGYPNRPTGDTSMTQYGVLSMWEAEHAGFKVPIEAWEKVANWLLRTQDPSGAWGYQGTDPGTMTKLVPQNEIRHSMVSAGLGSLYICADKFQFRRAVYDPNAGLPSALQRVRKPPAQQAPKAVATRVDLARLGQALDAGDAWMRDNYKIDPQQYQQYFMYAFERYQSFRELSATTPFQPSHWYDDGVYFLEKMRVSGGSWAGQTGEATDTAFALLFLLRSSKKSIERVHHLGPGTLITGAACLRGTMSRCAWGKFVPSHYRAQPNSCWRPSTILAIPTTCRGGGAGRKSRKSASRGTRQASGEIACSGRWRFSGRGPRRFTPSALRDFDSVPIIIAALQDPDDDVFVAAEEALKFMSRTISDPSENESITPARRAIAVRKWRNWFLSIRPNAYLDD